MQERLEASTAKAAFDSQVDQVLSKKFLNTMRGDAWKKKAEAFHARLAKWEARLSKPSSQASSTGSNAAITPSDAQTQDNARTPAGSAGAAASAAVFPKESL
jgi:hypothetical protein